MKKGILIFGAVFLLLISILLLIPILFKDQIKAKIDSEIAKTINAEVHFDASKFSLSLIRNFPNITISIGDFGMIGKAEGFEGDTLFNAKTMLFTADIWSVIKGEQIQVKRVYLEEPYILTKYTKDGKFSWDITFDAPEDTIAVGEEEPHEFAVAIDKWEIKNGRIIYDDQSMPFYADLKHMNHTGSGDLTQDVFDITTFTHSPDVKIVFDGVTYLNHYLMEADVKLNMNLPKSEYKFLENEFRINNFKFGFDGLIAMPTDDIEMDITYKATETDFKNLISLVPAIYTHDYESVQTEGKLAFDGWVKGIMTDSTMPGFGLNLVVNDAMMKYPDLPTAITNVTLDMHVDNKDGNIDNTVIDIKKFHMDMGNNPVDARVLVDGLAPYKIDADVMAKINLAEITQMYPLDGTVLKGLYELQVKANGIYSETQMPVIDAAMSLKDGYVKTADVPEPLEKINLAATIKNTDGSLASTVFDLYKFTMDFQKEPFEARAHIENMDDPKYDVFFKGILDLTKLTELYPLDDMKLSGRMDLDVQTKGVMSDIEAGNYGKTSTHGNMKLKNFAYESPDMPHGMKLMDASFTLNPDKMTINKLEGYLGKSDISVSGFFANYMGYMFGKQDTVLRGNVVFNSNKFDVNEWLTDDEATTVEESSESAEAAAVPKDLDFVLNASMGEVLYDNMVLKDMKGIITMKNGILSMDRLAFNSLGGSFLASGSYNTVDISKPKFDMDMKIQNVKIKDAFETFATVQAFAPTAKNMEGSFSTDLKMDGDLTHEMTPVMNTLNGAGVVLLEDAQLKGNKVMSGISAVTKINELDPLKINNVQIRFNISNGNVNVAPFDLKPGNMVINIGGQQSIDGVLNYKVKMDIPAGAVGKQVNSALGSLTGRSIGDSENIKLDLGVTGTSDKPKVALIGSSSVKDQAKDALKREAENRIREEVNNNEAIQRAKEEQERLRREAEERKKAEEERIRQEVEQRKKEEQERLRKEVEQKLPNIKTPRF